MRTVDVFCFQVRLPGDASDDVDEDPTGNKALWDRGVLNGASQKVMAGADRKVKHCTTRGGNMVYNG